MARKRINSKLKGAKGEREWARLCREEGFTNNGIEGEDVVGLPGIHQEVKRTEVKGGRCMDKITFTASLPPIQSAISVSGQGDGARIKLDIPQSELPAIIALQLLAGQAFKVTIEPEGGQ